MCIQVAEGVRNILQQRLCYNGLRCSNVCVAVVADEVVVTLIGLGLCEVVGTRNICQEGNGTGPSPYPWLAPEVRKGGPCTEASEVFSLSQLIVRWLVCYGIRPRMKLQRLSKWINCARDYDPERRPSLQLLLRILEELRQAASVPEAACQPAIKRKADDEWDEDLDVVYKITAKRQKVD